VLLPGPLRRQRIAQPSAGQPLARSAVMRESAGAGSSRRDNQTRSQSHGRRQRVVSLRRHDCNASEARSMPRRRVPVPASRPSSLGPTSSTAHTQTPSRTRITALRIAPRQARA